MTGTLKATAFAAIFSLPSVSVFLCRRLSESVAAVLVYEAIFGEGLKPHGPAERAVLAAQEDLLRAAEQLKSEAGVEDTAALVGISSHERHPRAARVNTLKISVKEALSHSRKPGNPGWQAAFEVKALSLSFLSSAQNPCWEDLYGCASFLPYSKQRL